MKIVNIHEAKTTLSALIALVEGGEEVTIARNGKPVARLTAIPKTVERRPGAWRELPGWKDFRYDSAIFAPMTDEELKEEGWE